MALAALGPRPSPITMAPASLPASKVLICSRGSVNAHEKSTVSHRAYTVATGRRVRSLRMPHHVCTRHARAGVITVMQLGRFERHFPRLGFSGPGTRGPDPTDRVAMAEQGRRGVRARWLGLPVVALVAWGCVRGGGSSSDSGSPARTPSPGASSAAKPSATPSSPSGSYDPADYAPQVRTYAKKAGISAQLLMAILYNEDYKPHDPAFERSW